MHSEQLEMLTGTFTSKCIKLCREKTRLDKLYIMIIWDFNLILYKSEGI